MIDVVADDSVDGGQGAAEFDGCGLVGGGNEWSQKLAVDLGVEDTTFTPSVVSV